MLTDRLSRVVQVLRTHCARQAAAVWLDVVVPSFESVSTRQTARAGACLLPARPSLACGTPHLHVQADTPIPSRGFKRARQHNAQKLCAAQSRCSLRRIICAMCACPQCASCALKAAAHPVQQLRVLFPRPPTCRALRAPHPVRPQGLPRSSARATRRSPRVSRPLQTGGVPRIECVPSPVNEGPSRASPSSTGDRT